MDVKLHIFAWVHNFTVPAGLAGEQRAMIKPRGGGEVKATTSYPPVDPVTHGIRINVRVPFWVKLVQDNGSNVHLILFPAKRIGSDSSWPR